MATAVGYFNNRTSATAAYEELLQRGVARDDISVVSRGEESGSGKAPGDHDVKPGEGAAIGGIAGLLLGAAAMLIPGIGPIVAIGPLAATLTGALTGGVTGAAVGGVTAALVHSGVDEESARYYDERFQQGGVLLTVHSDKLAHDEARVILQRHGADVRADGSGETRGPQTVGASPGGQGVAEPRPHVGDDPGLIDTPASTRSGMTGQNDPEYPVAHAPGEPRPVEAPASVRRQSPDYPVRDLNEEGPSTTLDPNRNTTPTTDVRGRGDPPGPPLI